MPMETAQVTTADLPGGWTRKVRTTASFLPSIQKPESSLDQRATVHNLFSSEAVILSSPFPLTNVSSSAGLLIFRKRERKAAAQTLDILVPVIYIYLYMLQTLLVYLHLHVNAERLRKRRYLFSTEDTHTEVCLQKLQKHWHSSSTLHCALPRLTFSTRPSAGNIR